MGQLDEGPRVQLLQVILVLYLAQVGELGEARLGGLMRGLRERVLLQVVSAVENFLQVFLSLGLFNVSLSSDFQFFQLGFFLVEVSLVLDVIGGE